MPLKRGEVSGLASLHVVSLAVGGECVPVLAPALKEADQAEDLQLRRRRKRVPLCRRATGCGNVGVRDLRGETPREVDSVGLDDESDECGHGDTAVLDLRLAQVADRRRLREEGAGLVGARLGECQRVPETDDGVEFFGEELELSLGLHDGRGRSHGWRRRRERRRERARGKGNNGEHGDF